MALPVIDGTYRVSFEWTNVAFLRDSVNVMHFRSSSLDAAGIISALSAHVTLAMWDHTPAASIIDTVTVIPLDGSTAGSELITSGASPWHGNASAGDIIPQQAVLVKAVTAKRGRSYRGRVFLPWPTEAHNANGVFDSTTQTAMQAAWLSFLTAMHSADAQPVVASYKLASAEDITGYVVEGLFGTQRRRQPR